MPQKQKVAAEEKVAIVRQCLRGELGVCEAGRKVGVAKGAIRQWIALYKAEGVEGLMPHARNRKYSPELKVAAVRDYLKVKEAIKQ